MFLVVTEVDDAMPIYSIFAIGGQNYRRIGHKSIFQNFAKWAIDTSRVNLPREIRESSRNASRRLRGENEFS